MSTHKSQTVALFRIFFACAFLFAGCSGDDNKLDLSGSWSLGKATFAIGDKTDTLNEATGSLVFSDHNYQLTLNLTIGESQFAVHVTKDESGECTVSSDYRNLGAVTAPNYWYGTIQFSPGVGGTWTTDFICHDDPQGSLELYGIPISAGSVRLIWKRK